MAVPSSDVAKLQKQVQLSMKREMSLAKDLTELNAKHQTQIEALK